MLLVAAGKYRGQKSFHPIDFTLHLINYAIGIKIKMNEGVGISAEIQLISTLDYDEQVNCILGIIRI